MSKVSQALDHLGTAGQELNTVGAAVTPIVKQITAEGITDAVNKAVTSHAPAAAPFATNLLAGLLHWLGLE